jgi:hypothetical protein
MTLFSALADYCGRELEWKVGLGSATPFLSASIVADSGGSSFHRRSMDYLYYKIVYSLSNKVLYQAESPTLGDVFGRPGRTVATLRGGLGDVAVDGGAIPDETNHRPGTGDERAMRPQPRQCNPIRSGAHLHLQLVGHCLCP